MKFHGCGYSPLYSTWLKMIRRCELKTDPRYNHYGGRGIKVCERWKDIAKFIEDMGQKPSLKHSLDRIDNNGDYEPNNCRWATAKEQANNCRTNILVEHNGQTKTLKQWSDFLGFKYKRAHKRMKAGWKFEEIIQDNPKRKRSAFCKRGHPMEGNNVMRKKIKGRETRTCRKCSNFMERRRYQENKESLECSLVNMENC